MRPTGPDVDFTGKPTWFLKWSDADLAYKPARRFFVERTDLESATAKLEGFDVMLSPEDYKTLPGKDPDGLYDGPVGSKWNTFHYFATYCAQDVHVLAESVWEKWRAAVLGTTRYDGRDEAHPQLATLPATVLSLDPGATTGYSLVRKELDGAWTLLACGSVEGVSAQNAEQLLSAAPTLLCQAQVTLRGGATCVGTAPVPLGALLTPATVRVVELQPYGTISTPQWQRMEALEAAFYCARVDSGGRGECT